MKRLLNKVGKWYRGRGMRQRVLLTFVCFTLFLLAMLWVFQIYLLDDFYKLLKTNTIRSTSQLIADNIDNEDLQALVDRLAEQNDVCVLVLDDSCQTICTADVNAACIIHHLNYQAYYRYFAAAADAENNALLETFKLDGFMKNNFNADKFVGHVPDKDFPKNESMVYIRLATTAGGANRLILVNAIATPVDATVQTLKEQLVIITVLMLLLSAALSVFLSRRLAAPIAATSKAALSLSRKTYQPPKNAGSYREIAELNQTLCAAAEELCKVDTLQKDLIANISHDLRTPLTMIEGYAEVMRDIPSEVTPENMQIIIDESKRLSTLVNAVLDYSKLQSGMAPLDKTTFDLTAAVEQILERYQAFNQQNGYKLPFEFEGHVNVCADETKIGQVIYNLVNNAITYTGEDKTVTIRQTVEGGKVTISVIDSGKGIPAEEIPCIWERYYRAKHHKRAAIGTGLGLSIVKNVLEMHHLPYGVESTVGKGSRFYFTMDVVEPSLPCGEGVTRG